MSFLAKAVPKGELACTVVGTVERESGYIADSQRYALTSPFNKAVFVVACVRAGSTLMVWVPFIHMKGHELGMPEPFVRRVALN